MEDDFEIGARKKVDNQAAITEAARKDYTIMAIRILMPIAAVIIALWLYSMIDNYISHRQYQQLYRSTFSS